MTLFRSPSQSSALLTALKASSRVLCVAGVDVLLEFDFLDGLFDEDFLACGSAGGGTCSLFRFFPIFSKPSYRVSDILRGAEENKSRRETDLCRYDTVLLLKVFFTLSFIDCSEKA